MKYNYFILGVLVCSLFIGIVTASDGSGYFNVSTIGSTLTETVNPGGTGPRGFSFIVIEDIELYNSDVSMIQFCLKNIEYSSIPLTSFNFVASVGATTIGTGTGSSYSGGAGSGFSYISLQFDTWDIGSLSGDQQVTITNFPALLWEASSGTYPTSPTNGKVMMSGVLRAPQEWSEIYFKQEYSNYYTFDDLSTTDTPNGGWVTVDRLTPASPSTINTSVNYLQISSEYKASGVTSVWVDNNPIFVSCTFPNDDSQTAVFYLDNPVGVSPTVTPTTTLPTPTPTPDISTELCGYWTFTTNSTNIVRNEYVLGTLTESDPDNKHKQIDWYLVLPSGQEVIQEHFVYDSGFFGFGAGWVNVNPYTGVASASSEAAAKQVTFDYPTSGTQWMRVKIYEDKSLVPAVYHDYNLFCTLEKVIYVSDTTQGTGQFAVNVWESGTNTLISGVTVHLYDYDTGEWYNKSASTGGTIYFNVVPGHEHRILVDESYWNTYDEDYIMPDPVPSQPYSIYLVRPLVDVVGGSYARFYVKDGSTYQAIYGASIVLSDGQVKATLPSGFAEFNVTDGTPYYYTVSRTGYDGQTGTFNISVDTVLPTVYLFPKAVVTTPTTVPYWTQTPTPLATYPNGTVIPGQTIQPTVTATLNVIERGQALTGATDVWYRNAEFLSNLMFVVVIIGLLGLMTKSIGGGRSGGRRRR